MWSIVNPLFWCELLIVTQGRGDQAALIYDSAMTGTVDIVTYKDLQVGRQNRRNETSS